MHECGYKVRMGKNGSHENKLLIKASSRGGRHVMGLSNEPRSLLAKTFCAFKIKEVRLYCCSHNGQFKVFRGEIRWPAVSTADVPLLLVLFGVNVERLLGGIAAFRSILSARETSTFCV